MTDRGHVYYHVTKQRHMCDIHGDSCEYYTTPHAKIARCTRCGAKVIVIYGGLNQTTKER